MHASDDSRSPARAPAAGIDLPDEAATRALGARVAGTLAQCAANGGLVVFLQGDLGAGKTTLVRGLLEALGHRGAVRSPTYTLIEPYAVSNLNLYHFDFYRFTHPDEFLDAGLEDYFRERSICLVEWPAKAFPHLPVPDLEIALVPHAGARQASLRANTERGGSCLNAMQLS